MNTGGGQVFEDVIVHFNKVIFRIFLSRPKVSSLKTNNKTQAIVSE